MARATGWGSVSGGRSGSSTGDDASVVVVAAIGGYIFLGLMAEVVLFKKRKLNDPIKGKPPEKGAQQSPEEAAAH